MGLINRQFAPFTAEQLEHAESMEPRTRAEHILSLIEDPRMHALVYQLYAMAESDETVKFAELMGALRRVNDQAESMCRKRVASVDEKKGALLDWAQGLWEKGPAMWFSSQAEVDAAINEPLRALEKESRDSRKAIRADGGRHGSGA